MTAAPECSLAGCSARSTHWPIVEWWPLGCRDRGMSGILAVFSLPVCEACGKDLRVPHLIAGEDAWEPLFKVSIAVAGKPVDREGARVRLWPMGEPIPAQLPDLPAEA